jgi:hypothetical protein
VRLTRAELDSKSYYHYAMERQGDGADMPRARLLKEDQHLPSRFPTHFNFIDAQGRVIRERPRHWMMQGLEGGGTGGFDGAERIAAMRFYIAVNTREVRVPFVLRDVELPGPRSDRARADHR